MRPEREALLARARQELDALYGEAAARELALWMGARPALGAQAPLAPLAPLEAIDQRTAILSVYPDHVGDDELSPLQALDRFLRRHLDGVFSHLHVLPFTCADGDDGYAITDHRHVHPRFGDWAQLRALAQGRALVCDFVANHVSTAHPKFLDFCATGESPYFLHEGAPRAVSWGHRVRTSELYQPFSTAAGPRWVFCTYGRAQADLNYCSPATMRFALEELDHLLRQGASVLRLDALPHLWKGAQAWGPHHPNVLRLLRVFRCFTELQRPGALLFAETQYHAGTGYFGDHGAQLGNDLPVPVLLLGCLLGEVAPLASWLERRTAPDPRTTPLLFLNTHDGLHLVPMAPPLGAGTSARLFERLRARGVVISCTEGRGERHPYELNSPLATIVHALATGGESGAGATDDAAEQAYLALHALLLALPGIPQIYFANLFGGAAPGAGPARAGEAAAPSGAARALNRRRFGAELEGLLAGGAAARTFSWLVAALATRGGAPALHPHAATRLLAAPPGVLRFVRGEGADALEVVANFSTQPVGSAFAAPHVDLLEPAGDARGASSQLAFTTAPRQVRWLAGAPPRGPQTRKGIRASTRPDKVRSS
jgi:glucosylglycerate phosphorylase